MRKVTFDKSMVDNNIEVSVHHLKQYFKFGHGANSLTTKAVHDVSFDIKKGECFGVVGESGCGKTTTGRSLIRLYNITSGSVYFEGHRISAGKRWNEKEIKWTTIRGKNKIKALETERKAELAYASINSKDADKIRSLEKRHASLIEERGGLKSNYQEARLSLGDIKDIEVRSERAKDMKANYHSRKKSLKSDIRKIKRNIKVIERKEKRKHHYECNETFKFLKGRFVQNLIILLGIESIFLALGVGRYLDIISEKVLLFYGLLSTICIIPFIFLKIFKYAESKTILKEKIGNLPQSKKSSFKNALLIISTIIYFLVEAAYFLGKLHIFALLGAIILVVIALIIDFAVLVERYSLCFNNPELGAKKAKINEEYKTKISEIKNHIKSTRREQKEIIRQVNYDNRHVDKKLMSKMQMIFQDPVDSLDPRMTVEDIIQEGLKIQGQHNKFANSKKVADVLTKVGLIPEFASRYPHEFSGGQRQRIGIARALIMNPSFLICDEPISALDVSIRAQIINLLNDLKEEMGLTIMFIAHDLSVVKYFCDRIAVMYFGEMVELATSEELFKHPLHPYAKALLSAIPKPDPLTEKTRKRIVYDPKTAHDYSKEKPTLQEVVPGHFILANSEELEKYRKEIAEIDKNQK